MGIDVSNIEKYDGQMVYSLGYKITDIWGYNKYAPDDVIWRWDRTYYGRYRLCKGQTTYTMHIYILCIR